MPAPLVDFEKYRRMYTRVGWGYSAFPLSVSRSIRCPGNFATACFTPEGLAVVKKLREFFPRAPEHRGIAVRNRTLYLKWEINPPSNRHRVKDDPSALLVGAADWLRDLGYTVRAEEMSTDQNCTCETISDPLVHLPWCGVFEAPIRYVKLTIKWEV